MTPEGEVLDRPVSELDWDQATAEKEGYETFMLKEIHEQAEAVAETVIDRTASGTGVDFSAEFDEALLRDASASSWSPAARATTPA
jgi:glucosamine--fructose-6-phosphate aminotransferase (isomerizing)